MLKTLKLKKKLLEYSTDKNEIIKYSLEIYSIILGYFARKKDRTLPSLNDSDETLNHIQTKIKELLNTNYKILGLTNNSLDSFWIFIRNLNNKDNKEICDILNKNFINGYNYYDYYHNNYNSIFDYILLHRHQKLEYKLKNFIN